MRGITNPTSNTHFNFKHKDLAPQGIILRKGELAGERRARRSATTHRECGGGDAMHAGAADDALNCHTLPHEQPTREDSLGKRCGGGGGGGGGDDEGPHYLHPPTPNSMELNEL